MCLQVTAAESVSTQAREAKRTAEAAAADAAFQLSQSERRGAETREVAMRLEERAEAFVGRLREAEARAEAAERANAEQEAGAREWETRLVDADRALSLSEAKAAVRCLSCKLLPCKGIATASALMNSCSFMPVPSQG